MTTSKRPQADINDHRQTNFITLSCEKKEMCVLIPAPLFVPCPTKNTSVVADYITNISRYDSSVTNTVTHDDDTMK